MTLKEHDKHLANLNLAPILDSRVRRVKWLYNNSNKLLMVYPEKWVRLLVHRQDRRIKELEAFTRDVERLSSMKRFPTEQELNILSETAKSLLQ